MDSEFQNLLISEFTEIENLNSAAQKPAEKKDVNRDSHIASSPISQLSLRVGSIPTLHLETFEQLYWTTT